MPIARCDPCRTRRNLVDRNRRAGRASNLRYSPCDSCRALESAERRRTRPSQAIAPDEQMVYRLLGGPEDAATRGERALAVQQLLAVRPRLTYREIAERVGVGMRTVQRHANAVSSRPN